MIKLRPIDLHWLGQYPENSADLCAHGSVEFQINGEWVVQPTDGGCTVSAAAVYLLRTLSRPHTKQDPVAEHLFPCCGNGLFQVEGQDDVLIIGCNSGIDLEVVVSGDQVQITAADGTTEQVTLVDWKSAVCTFSDAVMSFYSGSPPREPADEEDRKGFDQFLQEWSRRRELAWVLCSSD